MTALTLHIPITASWRGESLGDGTRVDVKLSTTDTHLCVEITAPYYDNPAPDHAPGSTPKLWEHEVVECFILGEDARYLEMEFGPHGHYLLLDLHGERRLLAQGMRCEYEAHISQDRRSWVGVASVPIALLPPSPSHYNAYAIHTVAHIKRHMARFPNHQDDAPNFHRLDTFGALNTSAHLTP